MIEISQLMFISLLVMVAIGYFCLGALFMSRRVLFWRIKWIELEHDLARAQGRAPRKIDAMRKRKS